MFRMVQISSVVLALSLSPAFANYVINSEGDAARSGSAAFGECDTGNVVPAPGAGFEPECTLRAAIQTANLVDAGSLVTIGFAGHIPTSSGNSSLILPQTALPDIETPVRIDGRTHPNYDSQTGTPTVILAGNNTSGAVHGLRVTANGSFSEIISLNIQRFDNGAGIQITGASNVFVSQNQIGNFPASNVPSANNWGIRISNGDNNIIGSSSLLAPPVGPWPNVISGNTTNGVEINGNNNIVGRNHIGVSPIGDLPTPNGSAGVAIVGGQGNQIGNSQGRPVIAANAGGQVLILQSASQATLQCVRIGTNAEGTAVLGSSSEPAIEALGTGHTIGTQACPNLIAGHLAIGRAGAFPVSANFNNIDYNRVGTNADGDDLGTGELGIFVYQGEGNQLRHNTVGNSLLGIGLGDNTVNNFVQSNFIGIDGDGNAMPIAGDGIIDAGTGNGNIIGGSSAEGNVIGNAGDAGIRLANDSSNAIVRSNLIGTNGDGVAAPVAVGILVNGSAHQIGGEGTGNRIGQAADAGIRLNSNSVGVTVAENVIGTESSLGGFSSTAIGIQVFGDDHQIGGLNSIGGMDVGIRVHAGTHDIIDNFIGVDSSNNPYPISTHGIRLSNGSSDVRVIGNRIGNSTRGIRINSDSPRAIIGNNWVGVAPDGTDIGNSLYGLYTNGLGTSIGTDPATSESMPNVFGFNGSGGGVRIGSDNTLMINNRVGLTPSGQPAPNAGEAGLIILDTPDNVDVGLSSIANANDFRYNLGHGISVRSAGQDVRIGVNVIGRGGGNGGDGIFIDEGVSDLLIQSSVDSSLGRLQVFENGGDGIGFHPAAGTGNQIRRVTLASNQGKGINLGPGGRDQDPGDGDTGPNQLQNFPEFDNDQSGFNSDTGQIDLRFRIDSSPANSAYPIAVDVYRNSSGSDGGDSNVPFGVFLGAVLYTSADAQEFIETSLTPDPNVSGLSADDWFIATATDALGNTSELSGRFGGPPVYSIGGVVSDLTGSGLVLQNNGGDDLQITQTGTFSFQFSTPLPDGEGYLVSVSQQPSGQSCQVNNASGTVDGADVNNVQVQCGAQDDMIFNDRFEFGNQRQE